MTHPERYRWLHPLMVELVDAVFDALGQHGNSTLPAVVALARPDAPAPLEQRDKKRLQRAGKADPSRAYDALERVLLELGCPTASQAASLGQALLLGSDGHGAARAFAEWADAALQGSDNGSRPDPWGPSRPRFADRALARSHRRFDMVLDAGATVASLVSLMGVLGDPLDHGPGPEGSVGWLEWMPYEHPDGGTLVSSRYLLLRGAYVARAADLGATDPTRASDQDEVIAEALGQEVEAVARGRIRQVGPERLERSNSDPRPISTELLCAHLGLDDPPPIRHLWTGTLLLVDRLQRRLLAQGTSAADIERAFGRYACQRVLHSFDLEPNWPHRLVSQIQSVSVATRRLTVRLAVRRRWEGARDPKSSPESR